MVPNEGNALVGLGHAYFGMGDYEKAHEQFLIALEIEPQNRIAKQRLGEAKYVLNGKEADYEDGQGGMEDGLSLIEARACLVRGNWFSDEGKHARAAAEYLRGLDFAPALTEALNNLANAYYMIGDNERAMGALEKARLLEPDNDMVARNLDAIGTIVDIYGGAESEPLEMFSLNSELNGSDGANEQ